MVEAAAAILLVGGALGIVETLIGAGDLGFPSGLPPEVVLGFVLNVVALATGWLLRNGQAWIVCLNVAAIYAFLYLSSFPNPLGIVLGVADLYVVAVVLYQRRWFEAIRAWRAALPIETRPVR